MYSIEYTKGILVVAYPNKQDDPDVDLPTTLNFEYWIQAFTEEELAEMNEKDDNSDKVNDDSKSKNEP